ncbi:hypothetical protein [Allomuricauda sp. SCSIO 65647]|uniref:hypothetical protein n=1 Tax=Allomuricauda sp. SCSIO 65647 TaxID=2908843 RepID=UPI001F2BF28D|nr:hypothetical protein [Muricauda sp. SCSIO 65647]UJH67137.1 hypothetical protein L0P89_14440 [Muricauda sp. SCSIO 65647]
MISDNKFIGYWKDDSSLGGELATKIKVKKGKRRLDKLFFRVLENASDSLLVRVNFYSADTKFPQKKLNAKNIKYLIRGEQEDITIDLAPYSVYVLDDFIVSLELLKVYGNHVGFAVSAADGYGVSYTRLASQSNWKEHIGSTIGFFLKTSYLKKDIDESKKDFETKESDLETELLSQPTAELQKERIVSGIVYHDGQPLSKASIETLGNDSSEIVRTDDFGRYTLEVVPREVLAFSYPGMQTVEVIVEDVTSILNIDLFNRIEKLDEVIVTDRRIKKTQEELKFEYFENKNLINTPRGIIDKTKSGFFIQIINNEDFNAGAIDFIGAIQGKFAGRVVRPFNNPMDAKVYFNRARSSLNLIEYLSGSFGVSSYSGAIFDVDGNVTGMAPISIPIENIERIALIPGVHATNIYGSIAEMGVVIINTKGANMVHTPNSKEPYDHMRSQNNKFDEGSLTKHVRSGPSLMIKELYKSKDEVTALATLDKNWTFYSRSAHNLFDTSAYFREVLENDEKADEILSKIGHLFKNDPVALKALAYKYEELNKIEEAIETYISILKLRPRYSQSYRDLANIYTKNNDTRNAYEIYLRYIVSRRTDTLPSPLKGIDSIIRTELVNLKQRPMNKWKRSKVYELTDFEPDYWPVRILVEWNNSEAEFDLQFVNPSNHYTIWNHTFKNSPEKIKDEKRKGYSSEQFFIDENAKGLWKVNLNYFGNKGFTPTYFKITIFHHYGTKYQTEEIRFYKIDENNININLFSVMNNPKKELVK